MVTKAKICGLKTAEAVEAALASGADYVGLVLFPASPRNVAVEEARVLADQARGRAGIVVLLVDADDAFIERAVTEVRPDFLQLHGDETRERVAAIKARWGVPVIKAIKVETAADANLALSYTGAADMILFDAKPPTDATRPGGHGAVFDWRVLDKVKDKIGPYMLSGGLDPGNVAAAIAATGAPIVDVSSGVEIRRGEKSPELIRRFLTAAKGL
ncbi:MAG: phosphoribosylanthranilate isomerase [Hyphomicrobiales bacterium]|nr:MAG: phosphoribosylanthranilate isomerase [Hyphomicrobiales bacterium]